MINIPRNVVLELTYRCNHACKFCSCPWYAPRSNYKKGKELSLEQWKHVIEKLYALGVHHFSISGGECLLNNDLPEILRYIHKRSGELGLPQSIVLISNGLAMSDSFLSLFKETGVELSMSLPGFNTFEYHTGVNNRSGVLHWFNKASKLGLTTTLNVTVTKKNIHELYETIAEGILSGASSVLLNRFLPGGRGLKFENDLLLTSAQLNEMLDIAEDVLSTCNRQGFVGTEFPKCIIRNPQKYHHISIGTYCAAAKEFFVIGPSGEIRVCNHSPRIVGNILSDSHIVDIDYWKVFAESKYRPNVCNPCKYLPICDCGCREVSNIKNGVPNQLEPSLENDLSVCL